MLGHLLFGNVLVGKELIEFLDVLLAVEGYAAALAAVAAGAAGFLIIALKALGDVVVDDEAHVGLVDAHAEGDGGHDDINLLHEELVLVFLAGLAVQSGVIGQGAYVVNGQGFGEFFHLFAAETVHDARLTRVLFDVFDDVLDDVFGFWTHLII